jgi:hypothetical protein
MSRNGAHLAAGTGIFQSVHPPLASNDAALGIEVQENILLPAPALTDKPILQRDRPIVIPARMADEKSGQGARSRRLTGHTI